MNFSVKGKIVNSLGFASHLQISHILYIVLVIVFIGLQPFKNVKAILNFQAIQKQFIG